MDWNNTESKDLINALLSLGSTDEAQHFLRDLMTEKEITEFSKRFKAARMLSDGRSYTSIIQETGLSSTTVARVAKWLKGSEGGYRSIIGKIHNHTQSPKARRGLS